MQELRERLVGEPCGFILFPEGTRARDGVMRSFRPGIGMLVADSSVPVVPARITGAFEAWPADRKRPRGGRVSVRIGPPLVFGDVANERAGWEAIAARLQAAVERLAENPAAP
jgi:1-acyl-sn-glycerol-3-phosphate acyltransferase